MKNQKDIQLIPEKKKILWYYIKIILVFDILLMILDILGSGIQNNRQWYLEGVFYFVILLILILLLVNREQKNNILNISSSGITGPKEILKSEKIFIKFNRINKSKKQNIIQKYICYYCIYSESNERISIILDYYSKEQQKLLFDRLNISL